MMKCSEAESCAKSRLKWIAPTIFLFIIVAWLAVFFSPRTARQSWQLNDVSGHLPDLAFTLTSDTGVTVTQDTYRHSVLLLYFGFTQCPDQCPATLSRLSEVMQKLGPDADRARVLFVTIDPAHDTASALHRYLAGFPAGRLTGLTGSEAQIGALARRCRAAYSPGQLVHGNAVYVFDGEGRARLLATGDSPGGSLVHDVRELLHEPE